MLVWARSALPAVKLNFFEKITRTLLTYNPMGVILELQGTLKTEPAEGNPMNPAGILPTWGSGGSR